MTRRNFQMPIVEMCRPDRKRESHTDPLHSFYISYFEIIRFLFECEGWGVCVRRSRRFYFSWI